MLGIGQDSIIFQDPYSV